MIRRCLRAFLPVALLLGAAPAWTQEWRLTHRSDDETFGAVLAFVDAASIRRTDDAIAFRYRVAYFEREDLRSSQLEVEAYCGTHRYRTLRQIEYSRDRIIQEFPLRADWRDAGEGSNIRTVLDAACDGRFLTGTVPLLDYVEGQLRGSE